MLRRIMGAALIIFPMVGLSGCWDYRDINTTAFPQLGAYDLHEEIDGALGAIPPDAQKVDLTVVIPTVSPEIESRFAIHKTSGLLVGNARGQEPYSLPGEYSAGVASSIVFGEDLAATGLNKVSDALSRGALNPHTENYAVAEGRGEDILRTPIKDYPSMGEYLRLLLRSANQRAFIPATTLHCFEVDQSPGKNPVMPLLGIRNDRVQFVGSAIFNKDKMVGKADLNETQYLVMLRGIKSTGNLPFILTGEDQGSNLGSVNVVNQRKVRVERNGDNFTFYVSINLVGYLAEQSSEILFTENEEMHTRIEDQVASDVTAGCNQFIKKMQDQYKVDCIDISKYALAKWRHELEDRIDQNFIENVDIKVDVKVKLENVGGEA